MLLKIGQQVINTDHISHAEFKVTASTSTAVRTVALWIMLGGALKGSPDIGLTGDQAERVWAKLTAIAEDATPQAPH